MNLTMLGICFLTSSIPLEFKTDGFITRFGPTDSRKSYFDNILVLTHLHVLQHKLNTVPGISLFNKVVVTNSLNVPEIYDGTQDLHGKKILIFTYNGVGDLILIQPAIRALYRMVASTGKPPRITLGCDWIHNFPYPNASYIHDVCPNILTLKEFCSFDVFVNLIPVIFQRSRERSMRDLCLDILKLGPETGGNDPPLIKPDHERVSKIKPFLDQIRKETGKKLLCVNWKSRFNHKNAPAFLFSQIADRLQDTYQALLFKDENTSEIMQKEIDAVNLPVKNLSHLIQDYPDTIAALSMVDAFVSVDTGIVHAAGALSIPGVALFGPFPPETHVSDYSSIIPIRAYFRGKECQEPCLETHRGCAEVNYSQDAVSPCFEAIKVDYVIQAFEDAVNRRIDDAGMELRHGAQKQIEKGEICAY